MIRNLKNIAATTVTLTDFNGLSIEPGEVVNGLMLGEARLRDSVDVIHALVMNKLSVNDGTFDYLANDAVNLIKGVPDQLTRDGKKIITSSDRPKDHYRQYIGAGDNIANKVRGGGDPFIFDIAPGETKIQDVEFLDDIYLKDGIIIYQGAELGCYVSVEIVAPPGIPYPAMFDDGNFDEVNGQFVPNAQNTGNYFIKGVSTVFNRFMHRMLILGSRSDTTSAPEPSFLPKVVVTRITVHNSSATANLKAVISLGIYREFTV